MIMKYVFFAVIYIFMVSTVASASEGNNPSLESGTLNKLIELAKEQSSQDEGQQYWWQVFAKLDKIGDDKLNACFIKKSDPTAMYQYVLEIGALGAIERVYWEKPDDFTKCIDSVLIGMELPPPPKSPFYFYLSEI